MYKTNNSTISISQLWNFLHEPKVPITPANFYISNNLPPQSLDSRQWQIDPENNPQGYSHIKYQIKISFQTHHQKKYRSKEKKHLILF